MPRRYLQLDIDRLRIAIAAHRVAMRKLQLDWFRVSLPMLEKLVADHVLQSVVNGGTDSEAIGIDCSKQLQVALREEATETAGD